MCRAAIPPYHYGLLHWAAAHVLCLAGAIGGACGVLKYEAVQHAKSPGQDRAPDWAVSAPPLIADDFALTCNTYCDHRAWSGSLLEFQVLCQCLSGNMQQALMASAHADFAAPIRRYLHRVHTCAALRVEHPGTCYPVRAHFLPFHNIPHFCHISLSEQAPA